MADVDFGNLSGPHLDMMLDIVLDRYGIPTQISKPTDFDNPYKDVLTAPEVTEPIYPEDSCKVLLDQPITGLAAAVQNEEGVISLSDKVETEHTVTTDAKLQVGWELRLMYPDGKTLNLRVTACLGYHAHSTVAFTFRCVVM